jgi:dihydropteroate synthase
MPTKSGTLSKFSSVKSEAISMDLDPSTRNVEQKGVKTNEITSDSNIRFMENKRDDIRFYTFR